VHCKFSKTAHSFGEKDPTASSVHPSFEHQITTLKSAMNPGSSSRRVWSAIILFLMALLSFRNADVLLANGQLTEVSTNIDGTSSTARSSSSSSSSVIRNPKSLHVTFRNHYDTKIYLFWRREDGPASLMGPIEASSDSSINTVQGHVFFACFDLNGTNRSLPYEVGKVFSSSTNESFL